MSAFAVVYCPHHNHYVCPSLSRNHGYAVTVFGGFAASTARKGISALLHLLCFIVAAQSLNNLTLCVGFNNLLMSLRLGTWN
jgi:hypothetical protein